MCLDTREEVRKIAAGLSLSGDARRWAGQFSPLPRALVMDIDNVVAAEDDPDTGEKRPRGRLDLIGTARLLQAWRVRWGTAFANRDFSDQQAKQFRWLRLQAVATHENVDLHCAREARRLLETYPCDLLLLSGDADFLPLVEAVRSTGHKTSVFYSKKKVINN